VHDGDQIYGSGVNVAARIESLANAGGICISRGVYDQVKDKLYFGFEYLGEHEVKNVQEPVRVYQVSSSFDDPIPKKVRKKYTNKLKWIYTIIALSMVLVFGIINVWYSYFRLPPIEPESGKNIAIDFPKGPSVAVLPFDNMSVDLSHSYFSDGLTEMIISGLSTCPKIFVIARNSSFTYKGKPIIIQKVADELGVQYVVEGSFQKYQDRVRITAQLIDANNGQHIWAETYDKKTEDIFELQDEITVNLITAMSVNISEGEQAKYRFKKVKNLEAYLKILKGYDYVLGGNRADSVLARQEANEAIALDPDNESAYGLLAVTYYVDLLWGNSASAILTYAKAVNTINKMLELNEDNSDAHWMMGMFYLFRRQYEKAIASGKRAVELNPNGADAHIYFGSILSTSGYSDESLRYFERAFKLNPIPPGIYYTLYGETILGTKDYLKAVELFEKAISIEPDDVWAHLDLVVAYTHLGQHGKAKTAISEVYRIDPNFVVDELDIIDVDIELAKKNYYDVLRKAGMK